MLQAIRAASVCAFILMQEYPFSTKEVVLAVSARLSSQRSFATSNLEKKKLCHALLASACIIRNDIVLTVGMPGRSFTAERTTFFLASL